MWIWMNNLQLTTTKDSIHALTDEDWAKRKPEIEKSRIQVAADKEKLLQKQLLQLDKQQHRRHHRGDSEIHHALRLVGIAQERVIDVHFPAHSTVGLLIHSSYEKELRELLSQARLQTKDDFDPTAASTIGDPILLAKLTEEERANEAQKLYQELVLAAKSQQCRTHQPSVPAAEASNLISSKTTDNKDGEDETMLE
ncbi:hypothetical protein BDC45DRAFT_574711 [Circinella umbellata]|nr:hypothetical protein BDC45DRAFT_574711 [Circinella umbellata]